jgi:hypothetical protein
MSQLVYFWVELRVVVGAPLINKTCSPWSLEEECVGKKKNQKDFDLSGELVLVVEI